MIAPFEKAVGAVAPSQVRTYSFDNFHGKSSRESGVWLRVNHQHTPDKAGNSGAVLSAKLQLPRELGIQVDLKNSEIPRAYWEPRHSLSKLQTSPFRALEVGRQKV